MGVMDAILAAIHGAAEERISGRTFASEEAVLSLCSESGSLWLPSSLLRPL